MIQQTLEWDRFALNLGNKPAVMGVLNITPDSFSDGGRFFDFERAVAQGQKLAAEGADILDIGGESSRPFAEPVSEEEEKKRVLPVIEKLAGKIDIPISIDTMKSGVAAEALQAGAAVINDISALERDPAMADLASEKQVPVILMHMKGTPETMQIDPRYDDLIGEISDYLSERADFAVKKGIRKDRIIIDPGIGFGKSVADNLAILNRLDRFVSLGFPLLVGPSRKSFIQKLLSPKGDNPLKAAAEEVENGTLAALACALLKGAHIVRVHDVAKATAFIRTFDAILNA